MKKFPMEEGATGGSPADAKPAEGQALRELVRFAMRRGYYDALSKPVEAQHAAGTRGIHRGEERSDQGG